MDQREIRETWEIKVVKAQWVREVPLAKKESKVSLETKVSDLICSMNSLGPYYIHLCEQYIMYALIKIRPCFSYIIYMYIR